MQYVTPFVKSDFICKHTLLQLMWSLGLISFNRVAIFFLFNRKSAFLHVLPVSVPPTQVQGEHALCLSPVLDRPGCTHVL